jgi:hypothetical protein
MAPPPEPYKLMVGEDVDNPYYSADEDPPPVPRKSSRRRSRTLDSIEERSEQKSLQSYHFSYPRRSRPPGRSNWNPEQPLNSDTSRRSTSTDGGESINDRSAYHDLDKNQYAAIAPLPLFSGTARSNGARRDTTHSTVQPSRRDAQPLRPSRQYERADEEQAPIVESTANIDGTPKISRSHLTSPHDTSSVPTQSESLDGVSVSSDITHQGGTTTSHGSNSTKSSDSTGPNKSTRSVAKFLKPHLKQPSATEPPPFSQQPLAIERRVSVDQHSLHFDPRISAKEMRAPEEWHASDYDTSELSVEEMYKLQKKGVNPALYAEMRAARRQRGKAAKWLSPLVGNTYIG